MTREEATRLVFETEGRVCVRFFRRKDGRIITDDCPRALAAVRKRLRRWAAVISGLFGGIIATSTACVGAICGPEKRAEFIEHKRQTTTQPALAKISEFQGEHRFLSNFWPATVVFEGITYPTSEHAYQSAKTLDMAERRRIAALATPSGAKREGRALPLRADWEQVKFEVMERVVRDKFTRNADLREKLLATGDATLEEGNTWGDRVWGVYEGQGENRLGKILMKVRDELGAP
ncbi:MAG: NADAR family protein [Planctomycetes bacterium]|nr:NADAR family protein [Planctomycetota bacterium]